ncbi:cilia- and flagella-associated protein 73 [Harpia harpyja]|uniref:cilia- and flagella-associated protein 73 n=1 Tax=Harpia harpyja TaxID=202280 RepID=UPI0022B12EC3|nr:cilia- and flagella-associated protein 73 [Harpia harpyja]
MRGGEHTRGGSEGDLRARGGERRHSWGTQRGAAYAPWVKPWGLSPPWDVAPRRRGRCSEPCRENPREPREPPAAPGNSVVPPPSRPPHVPASTPASQQAGGTGKMAFDLEEYLRTAFRDKLRLPTVPTRDGATLLPSTRLLLKRREVAEVERALQSQREEFRQRMECLAQRRRQLGRREEQLRDVVLKFDAFLKASAARQERALRRADEERARAAGQGAEAARLRRELEGLLRRRERLARRLRSLRGFGDYLRSVLAGMGQFQDIPAMLAHFGALAGARAALAQQAEARQEQLAQGWAQLRRYRKEAGSKLLCTNDELTRLRARLEATRRDVLQGESHWAHVQSTATQKTLLLGQIKLAVLNLFQLATARLEVPTDVALEDTEAQLDTVLLCVQDLAAISAELRPRQPGTCPPRLPVATGISPLRHGGARVPPSQE